MPSAADIVNAAGWQRHYRLASTLWVRAMVHHHPTARAVLTTRMWLLRGQ